MTVTTVSTQPIEGQKPGTSGLRKKTLDFMSPHFLENYIQSILNATDAGQGETWVLGGDGRYFNDRAAQVVLRIAAANGVKRVIVGQNGILSTPAASHLIRMHHAAGGIILSASHNPGGHDEDFGVKFNTANGGPAPQDVTDRIYSETLKIESYRILEAHDVDLSSIGRRFLGKMTVDVVDPVADYSDLMERLFDFNAIRALVARGFRLRFDAMNAVTGPYAVEILEKRLGAAKGTVMNAVPLADFGGLHPDPNPHWAKELMAEMFGTDAPDFGAASDGDGDRNMILGRRTYVAPSDSLAIIAANAFLVPGYRDGLKGVARSMPTSSAVDQVAQALGINCYETPTGWKFFGNLMDAGLVSLCGEESFGTGSNHVREKDGLWAVLMWLNILAAREMDVADLLHSHWREYGRNYYSRHDFEAVDAVGAADMMRTLREKLPDLPGQEMDGMKILIADDFAFTDPIDGLTVTGQGIRVVFDGGRRFVMRLSGTGTVGATLRVYLEHLVPGDGDLSREPAVVLAPIAHAANAIAGIRRFTGRTDPDVMT